MVIIDTTTVCLEVGERLVALGRYSEARELYIALYKVSAAAVPCEASCYTVYRSSCCEVRGAIT